MPFCKLIMGKGSGDFLLRIYASSACYYALCHDTGSACCLGKIGKRILSCRGSLLKTEAALPSALTEKFMKKFS